jgi:hypothetical protein
MKTWEISVWFNKTNVLGVRMDTESSYFILISIQTISYDKMFKNNNFIGETKNYLSQIRMDYVYKSMYMYVCIQDDSKFH